ncbi:MAG: ATP-binding protein [Thermoplasmata archaeon]|nr:ATP-binding protein [Thermoplasmata archaeon]
MVPGIAIGDTSEVSIPVDPLSRVIGQDHAVGLARTAARQRRHLLLIGPPGIGKSMIAMALSFDLPQPQSEVHVVHNPENPERPFIEVLSVADVHARRSRLEAVEGVVLEPREVPLQVVEKLGYFCRRCETYSAPTELICPGCGAPKGGRTATAENPFQDLMGFVELTIGQISGRQSEVRTTRTLPDGTEEVVVYERAGDMVRMLDEEALGRRREIQGAKPRKVLVPLDRRTFVMATGSSETELLGDVRHDPYGGHPGIGTPPYERVVTGTVHDAHEGVLFIDEVPHLGHLQRSILTAMQEKAFPISGRNPQSAGASVRVDAVPCDFILVAACNVQDLPAILAPLRSRILGSGYEVVLDIAMPDSDGNRFKVLQFIAQEIQQDGRIPHADAGAVEEMISEARKRALAIDGRSASLTLRLRDLGGLIRASGDIAVNEGADLISREHVIEALKVSLPAEAQIRERYGSLGEGVSSDMTESQKFAHPYHYWNESAEPPGYE